MLHHAGAGEPASLAQGLKTLAAKMARTIYAGVKLHEPYRPFVAGTNTTPLTEPCVKHNSDLADNVWTFRMATGLNFFAGVPRADTGFPPLRGYAMRQ